ncbi:phage tail tape measure protein [Anaerovorax odorimutans]|uniref:hypothetical protein n=1 Tax=Anaerovorax odorimutans TaxID=109327 RepID=UPI0004080CD2|nr:hypothetical protein [Anaerovorax odorimutans]
MSSNTVVSMALSIKDNVSKVIENIVKQVKKLKTPIKNAQNSFKNFTKSSSEQLSKISKKTKAFASSAIGSIKNYARASVDAAQVQLESELKLSNTLKQKTNATNKQIKSILNLTAAQQKNGVVSDEVQLAGAQQLAMFANQAGSINTLIPAMNNLLVQQNGLKSTSEDAANIGNVLGNALQGQAGELSNLGIKFSKAEENVLKFGTEEEKAAALAKIISNNVGDMNNAMAQTDAGKIQQAKMAFANIQEEVGKQLLPELGKLSVWFTKHSPQIQGIIIQITKTLIREGKKAYVNIKQIFEFIKANKTAIKVILGVASGLYVFIKAVKTVKSIIKIIRSIKLILVSLKIVPTIIKGIVKAFNFIKIAWKALSILFATNPMLLVFIAIAAACVLVWKNWDVIKVKAIGLYSGIVAALTPLGEFFSGIWSGIKAGFREFINFIITGINTFTATLSWIPEKLSKVPGFKWAKKFIIPQIPLFANGGIATHPSIFGEAGAEMAIPLKRNNTRSRQLLSQADKLINGEKIRGGVNINIAIDTFIGEDGFVDTIGEKISRKLIPVINNMA